MRETYQIGERRRAFWHKDGLIVALFFPNGTVEKFETQTAYVYDNSQVIAFEASNGQTMVASVPFKIMASGG